MEGGEEIKVYDCRRRDRIPNAWVRKLCGLKSGKGERIDEGLSGGLEILKDWRIVGLIKGYTRASVQEIVQRKRRIDSANNCFRKKVWIKLGKRGESYITGRTRSYFVKGV